MRAVTKERNRISVEDCLAVMQSHLRYQAVRAACRAEDIRSGKRQRSTFQEGLWEAPTSISLKRQDRLNTLRNGLKEKFVRASEVKKRRMIIPVSELDDNNPSLSSSDCHGEMKISYGTNFATNMCWEIPVMNSSYNLPRILKFHVAPQIASKGQKTGQHQFICKQPCTNPPDKWRWRQANWDWW